MLCMIYFGDYDDDLKMFSYCSWCTVIIFSQENKGTQQTSMLILWHDAYLLFVNWKWIIIKSSSSHWVGWRGRGRGGIGLAVSGWKWWRRLKGRQERQALCSFTKIHHIIPVWLFCFFISLRMFLCGSNPSSTVCSSSSDSIIERSMH